MEAVGMFDGGDSPDSDMVLAFAESVLIYGEEHIEIRWNFPDDLIRDVMEME